MIPHCLSEDDLEAVRRAVLRYERAESMSHADVAVACKLSYHSVKDFMRGRSNSCRIVAHLVGYLPLDLIFHAPHIEEQFHS